MKLADRFMRGLAGGAPKVSVATTTYGHEAFIGDAIEGVLMQDTDFPVEMVIGEDCSPDGTRGVILKYAEKYPGFIRLSNYERNLGSNRNFRNTLARCRGEYVALLDGDDYWTSPDKLRLQVAKLESDPRFTLCCHAVNRERGGIVISQVIRPTGRKPVYRLKDLASWVNMMPLSMVYRRSALPSLPSWFEYVHFGDWAIQVLLAEQGDIAYLPRVMGTHRIHHTNIWCANTPGKSVAIRLQIEHADLFIRHLGDERAKPFERAQYRRYYELVHALLDEGEPERAQEVLSRVRAECGADPRVSLLEPWLVRLHMKAPAVYRWVRPHLHRLLHPWGLIVRPVADRVIFAASALRHG
ncbi:MAG: glycosyltransferase [Alphaproteobacteria bacterium]